MNKGTGMKSLNIIHKAMLMGQIIFAAVCLYLVYSGIIKTFSNELDKLLQIIALALSAAGLFGGSTYFKKKILLIKDMQTNVKSKFEVYRTTCLLQWALLEVPVIFSVICFFLTANYAFIALALLLIIIFAMQAPSKSKVALQLQVNEAELEDL